jgi:hypothetical protein
MVSSGVVSQKLCSASPRGSKKPRTGFNFLAKTARSAEVSIDMEALVATRCVTLAPLKLEGVNAAAEEANRAEIRNFIVKLIFFVLRQGETLASVSHRTDLHILSAKIDFKEFSWAFWYPFLGGRRTEICCHLLQVGSIYIYRIGYFK